MAASPPASSQPLDRRVHTRLRALQRERSSWVDHWMALQRYILPRAGRFLNAEQNRGERKHHAIYDGFATRAARVLAAGMLGGMTSPARPWFRLETTDPELNLRYDVRVWLDDVTNRMRTVFSTSNTYRMLRAMYAECGVFGTAASIVVPDYRRVVSHRPLTIGQYYLAASEDGAVNTLYREFQYTVGQLVETFGLDRVSQSVRNNYYNNNLDVWVPVIHAIEPRLERDASKRDPMNMAWRSVYFETGARNNAILRESGFRLFRVLAPRWEVTAGDVYGSSCPGMDALGDIQALQHSQYYKAKALAYAADPPLALPTSMAGQESQTFPGGRAFYDGTNPQAIRSMFDVRLDMNAVLEDVRDKRDAIAATFYSDLFISLVSADQTRMTATEVAERHEEKLMMLGPTIEQLHFELLMPLIDITFADMLEAGLIPPPPDDLTGQDVTVNFISMLAQAQRAIQTNSVDRFVYTLGQIAPLKPEVLDKLNPDALVDAYADMLGVDPDLIYGSEQVAFIREQRAQQIAQQQTIQNAETLAKAGAAAAQVDIAPGRTLATDIINAYSGYTSPASDTALEP